MFHSYYEKIPDVHKIAVVRANALGDFIFALPALEALRGAYPQAEIVFLGCAWHASFLAGRPGPIDRVVVIPATKGVSASPDYTEDPIEQERFFEAMRKEHFDLALQIHGGGRYSNPFLLKLGAKVTVGLKTPDAAPLDRWIPYIYFQSEIMRYLEVVSLIGAIPNTLEARILLTDPDMNEAWKVVPEREKPLVALHPGAGDPQRRWPPEKFAAVGDALASANAHVVVTGTREEQAVVEEVVSTMKAEAQNICDRISLGGLASLFSRCRVVVSNDSGPLHLAAAVGAATVGIYWCCNLYTAGMLTRLCHCPHVSWQVTCPVCGIDRLFKTCEHRPSFVANIPTNEVRESALALFHATSSTNAVRG
jgi:ADP-heptose:LPS heptosyltransferase